jgi:hypothetical protein
MVRMNIADGHQPIVLLNDGETFTGLGGCELIVLTHEEAVRVADDNWEPNKLAGEMLFGFFGSGSNDFVLAGGPQARSAALISRASNTELAMMSKASCLENRKHQKSQR